jgi:hypothetical protein
MKPYVTYALAISAAAAMLAACDGVRSSPPALQDASRALPAGHLQPQRQSWLASGLSKTDLLYVSNGNGEVTVYRYSDGTLLGVLTDFTQPMGECAAGNGDVYIADQAAKKILEFAHGGKKPIKTFDDSPDSPYTCAVDPVTGNLAVASDDAPSGQGNIAIWKPGSSNRTIYSDSTLGNFVACAYSNHGELLVSNGGIYPYGTRFAWLPEGGAKLLNITVPGPAPTWEWYYISGIQWDGLYFVLDEYDVYRIAFIHGQAYYLGTTSIDSPDFSPVGPYWVYNNHPGEPQQGTQLLGAMEQDGESPEVNYFAYPSGGEPTMTFSHGLDSPFGVTVSLGKQ